MGWLEFGVFGRIFKTFRTRKFRIDDTRHDNKDAQLRAANEEQRRLEETMRRRSFGRAAMNVEVFNQKKAMQLPRSGQTISPLQTTTEDRPSEF